MKENNQEELITNIPSFNNIRRSVRGSTVYSRSSSSQHKSRVPYQNKTTYKKRESEYTFDRILNNKIKQQEEEERLKMEVKMKTKLLKKVNTAIRKDYLVFFFLFLSSSLNFNYLYLPFIFIGTLYLSCIGNFKFRPMRLKYFLEIFVIGYSSYLLLFKIIIFSLIKNENEYVNIEKKSLFIDLGNCILKDRDSNFYFIMNFLPEIIIILINGYGLLISFRSRLLTPKDLRIKTITNFKLSKYAFIIYVLMVASTMFNLSYLSLLYIFCIQLILFLCAIKFRENVIKKILKYMIYSIIIISSLQIIILNWLNIPSINKIILNNEVTNLLSNKYLISKQIGINITNGSEETKDIIINFIGYFFFTFDLIILINTSSKLSLEVKPEANTENNDSNNNEESKIDKLVNKKSIFYKITSKIMKFLYHPVFNFEVSRILSILWTYFYLNIFSFGILVFIFISFFSPHTKRNKCLVLYILFPMLTLSLGFFHISNIEGYFEEFSDIEKIGYMSIGIKKYDYIYIEYPLGHLFFLIVMFLINSLFTAEALQQWDIGPVNLSERESSELVEMQDLSNINKLEESILPKDNNEISIRESKTVEENIKSINDIDENDSDDNNLLSSGKSKISKVYTERSTNNINTNANTNINNRRPIDINISRNSTKIEQEITFLNLIKKLLLKHIDKITLVVMYFVSVHTVNVIHVLLILIFIFQIISPVKINYCYKINILLFQFFYLIEFIIDLIKSKYNEQLKEYKTTLDFFVVYNEDINTNDIEIFIYGIIY